MSFQLWLDFMEEIAKLEKVKKSIRNYDEYVLVSEKIELLKNILKQQQ